MHAAVHAPRTAGAEAAIALVIALAQIDRVEVVPQAQEMRRRGAGHDVADGAVGVFRRGINAAVRELVDLDREEQVFVGAAPAQFAAAAAFHRRRGAPDLDHGSGGHRAGWLQTQLQHARIGHRGAVKPDYREHIGLRQQVAQRGVRIADIERRRRRFGLAQRGRHAQRLRLWRRPRTSAAGRG
jgi:hypothetical protein